jgi:outer membrane protein OmpA-like peptidoglycan-associated protein
MRLLFWRKFAVSCPAILFCLFFSLLFNLNVYAEQFSFSHKVGDKFRILSVTNEDVLINGKLDHSSEILERISSEVLSVSGGVAEHKALFQTAEKIVPPGVGVGVSGTATPRVSGTITPRVSGTGSTDEKKIYEWADESEIVFGRDRLGKLTVDPKYVLPTVRDVPHFQERDFNVGDSWIAEGREVQDLRGNFGIRNVLNIPFRANYKYLGQSEWKGKMYPAFSIEYNISERPNGFIENSTKPVITPRTQQANVVSATLVRISGSTKETLFWDRELGQAAASSGDFTLILELSDKTKIEFRAHAEAEIIEAEIMDREDVATAIKNELAELGIENAEVKIVDDGVMISLDNIQFAADSARLLPSENAKLIGISEILKHYSGRDILVGGHTALAGTEKEREKLSSERAAAVADFFIQNKVRTSQQVITRGYGAAKPIADNRTEEGRIKNRRVEITILEN